MSILAVYTAFAEMRLPSGLANLWNERDAERGIAWGLIAASIIVPLIQTSDYLALAFDNVRNQNPYGVLWYWLNPGFWTDVPYRIYVTAFMLVGQFLMYWFFVRNGRLSKFLFYTGWLIDIVWMRGSVYQNVTVTTFAPLISIFPWMVLFVVFQKIPLGWSWPIQNNQHWWCAFVGNSGFTSGDTITFPNGQTLISCPGGWLRWNPAYSWFWSYAFLVFSVAYPFLWWGIKCGGFKRTFNRLMILYWSLRLSVSLWWFFSFKKRWPEEADKKQNDSWERAGKAIAKRKEKR